MSAERSFHYTVRLDIQRTYGSPQAVSQTDVSALKDAFERRVRESNGFSGTLASVVWIEEVKHPAPESQSTIL